MAEPSTGEKIAAWLNSIAAAFVEEFQELLRKLWPSAMANITDEDRQKVIDANVKRNERLAQLPYMPEPLLGEIREAGEGDSLLLQLKAILLDVAEASAVLRFGMAPAGVLMNYEAERILQTARLDPATATAMLHRQIVDLGAYRENMADQGWSVDQQQAWFDLIRERPGVGDYVRWSYRVQQDPEGARDELTKRGMTSEDVEIVFELSRLIPGPGDLVRFALREVWKPKMRAEQLSPDAPGEYYDWMQKIGYSKEHAQSFWAAHWVLPAVGLGYEMFHRLDEFGETDLRALMTRLDILPKYHDGLIKIAYPTISRVDIRRIYRDLPAGSVDVYKRHLDLGYSPADAELMTTWVEAEYVRDVTEPLKSDVLGAYGDDLIGRNAALQMLLDIGSDPWAAEIALDRKDIAKAKKLQAEVIRQAKTLYINGDYNRGDVHAKLGAINLPAIRVDRLLEEWDVSKAGKVARPSVAKLEGYFFRDIIDRGTFVEHLGRHKYSEPYLGWSVRDIERRKMEALVKEEERTAKEAERVAKLVVKTGYEEAKSIINYQIAQLRVHLLEIRLYIGRLAEWPERKDIMGIIEDARVDIAGIQVEIQEKRANLTSQQTILRTLAVPADMEALYTMIDNAQIAITDEQAAISELRAVIIEAKGRIRLALPGAEVEEQRQVIDAILIDIASESVDIAKLRLVIAVRKAQLSEATTSEDIAALEEEMRLVQLEIAGLEAERARLKL